MPLITINMYPGRTEDQKAALCEAVTEAFVRTCGGNPDGVWTIIQETPPQHWAAGGVLNSRRGDGADRRNKDGGESESKDG